MEYRTMSVITQKKLDSENELKKRKHYFSELPLKVQEDIRAAQHEVAVGQWISNEEVFRKTDEWLEND
jgi:hypothetical protein